MAKVDVWKRAVGKCKDKKGEFYGFTDLNKKTITINKSFHKKKGIHGPGISKNKNGTAKILDTIVHEEMHAAHPKMHEKTVRKLTPKKVKRLTKKAKKKLYSKYKK